MTTDHHHMDPHTDIREAVAKLCADYPGEYWRKLDREMAYPTQFVTALTESGFLSALIPEEYGGAGLSLSAAAVIMEEIQRQGCNGAACHAQMYTMGTLLRHGSAAQKRKWLPGIASGALRMQAFGVTESTTGSDTTQLKTRAELRGNRYVVTGQKVWTSRAMQSDLMLLLARTTPADQVKRRADGISCFLVDLREADLERAKSALGSANVETIAADVSQTDSTKRYIERTVARFGKIDVLFSNAGNQGPITSVTEYPEDVFDAVMAVHVRGSFLCCKYGIPQMNDGGSIIITSSVVGAMGAPGAVAYVTAKHAQVGLMRSVAKEAARRRIRVNTLHPGPIDNAFQAKIEENIGRMAGIDATRMLNEAIPLHRHAAPEEIARSALYLASDLSSFVTSSMLMADGGLRG